MRYLCFAGACAALSLLLVAPAPGEEGPEGDASKVPIYVDLAKAGAPPGLIQIGDTLLVAPGTAVRISGVAALELAGKPLRVRIISPEVESEFPPEEPEDGCPGDRSESQATPLTDLLVEDSADLEAMVSSAGSFEAEFTPKGEGEYGVVVTDAEERYRGEAKFISGILEAEQAAAECKDIPQEQVEEAAAGLTEVICKAADVLNTRVEDLPPSPAKDELVKRLGEVQRAVKAALPCGEAPQWVNGTYHVNKLRKLGQEMRKATQVVVGQMDAWLKAAEKAREEGQSQLAEIRQGEVFCDQLDTIVSGLKLIDSNLDLAIQPAGFLVGWTRQNPPAKLAALIPSASQDPAVAAEVGRLWNAIAAYEPRLELGRVTVSAVSIDRAVAASAMVKELTAATSSRIFEQLCYTFKGPVSGTMSARFLAGGKTWWRYTIEIKGRITLRYPADAQGDEIELTGEFIGEATRLDSADNAVPQLFPELAQGTVFKTMRNEPATPIRFVVPVRGELKDKKLRLELQPAIADFDGRSVKVVQIMLPVLSLWPEVLEYELPYKGAHFILLRAMNDGPAEFDVRYWGDTMKIERTFDRKRATSETDAAYSLKVTACNPGC